jgi:hypothetical protein
LLKLFREARTYEEEQGVNILFLAIGFLEWFEDPRSEERCFAPLLLVPVSLERRQGRDQFLMRGREDDMVVNVPLAEKLRAAFGINLPELPEGDEWLPSGYFAAMEDAIAAQKRWRVERLGMGLGFFSFSKFLMWRDLDANAWSDPAKLLQNRLVVRLLGETVPGDHEQPLVSDDEPIDQHIDLAAAIHVLDADSSQAVCVEEARLGRNLVIQGPPGTGKSQTIANIIATAVHEGKSVLFIAEKAAALDVVHSRLKAVGLEALCLEIHSKKATKQSVVASLAHAIQAPGTLQLDSRTTDDLRAARDRLNDWSALLHREIRKSGRTPYQVMGTVLRLGSDHARVLEERLDVAANWDRERIQEAERAVERAFSTVSRLGVVPIEHPWHGVRSGRLTPFDASRLQQGLDEGSRCANELVVIARKAVTFLGASSDLQSVAEIHSLARILQFLARAPRSGREALCHPAWRLETARLQEVLECGMTWSACNAELGGSLVEDCWTLDLSPTRQALDQHGRSISGFSLGATDRQLPIFEKCFGSGHPESSGSVYQF